MQPFSPFSSKVDLPVPLEQAQVRRPRDLPKLNLSLIGLGEPVPSMSLSPLRAPPSYVYVERFVLDGSKRFWGAPDRQVGHAVKEAVDQFAANYRKKFVYFPKDQSHRMTTIQHIFAKMRPFS